MSTTPAESPVRVACIQMEPRVGALHDNIADSVARIDAAAAQGAKLMVLPELTSSGYVFATRDEAFSLAEEIPHGPACTAWMAAAKRHGAWVVAGLAERVGSRLYNAAVLVGPDGRVIAVHSGFRDDDRKDLEARIAAALAAAPVVATTQR